MPETYTWKEIPRPENKDPEDFAANYEARLYRESDGMRVAEITRYSEFCDWLVEVDALSHQRNQRSQWTFCALDAARSFAEKIAAHLDQEGERNAALNLSVL